jgi:hypothetical protein
MSQLDATKKLMGALVRMKPKPHEEIRSKQEKKKLKKRTVKAK